MCIHEKPIILHRSFVSISRFTQLTLHLQVQRYFISAPVIAGNTRVIPRILSFHGLDDKAAVSVDAAPSVDDGWARAPAEKTDRYDISEYTVDMNLGICLSRREHILTNGIFCSCL